MSFIRSITISQVDLIFQGSNVTNATYSGSVVTGFRAGSVITTYKTYFSQDSLILRSNVKAVTEDAIGQDGSLPGGSLSVDPEAVAVICKLLL